MKFPVIRGERSAATEVAHLEVARRLQRSRGCPASYHPPRRRAVEGPAFGRRVPVLCRWRRAAASRSRSGCRPRARTPSGRCAARPSRGVPAARGARALPLGVRGVHADARCRGSPPGRTRCRGSIPGSGSGRGPARPRPSGARRVSRLPVTCSSPASEVGSVRPVSAARSSREKRSSRSSAAQCGGCTVMLPFAVKLPSSPVRSASTARSASVPSPRKRPRSSPSRLERGERAPDPLERERLETARRSSSASVSRRVSRWSGPIAVLDGRPSSWCRAVPRKVTLCSGPSSVPTAASRPSRITAGATSRTVRRSTSERRTANLVKVSPLSRAGPDTAFTRDQGHRLGRAPGRRRRPSRSGRPSRRGTRCPPATPVSVP